MSPKDVGPRLGRGLAALLGEGAIKSDPAAASIRHLRLDQLEPNPFQPRTDINPEALHELTESIRVRGILQPILVRPHPTDPNRYQIVAGERRWRAASNAGLHEVPALVRETSDTDAAAVALVENLQRQDLNAIDEAEGYNRLIDQFGLTQEALGIAVGKSRGHITNTLRLLNLPPTVKDSLRRGIISAGHARALLGHPHPEAALGAVVEQQLSVRQTEAFVSRPPPAASKPSQPGPRDPNIESLEHRLVERMGLKVKISFNGRGGTVQLHYADLDQLDALIARLTV